jgi:hypothetical protein
VAARLGPTGYRNSDPHYFPAHALLILEERLREQEAKGVKMPEGMERDELALRILVAAETQRIPGLG